MLLTGRVFEHWRSGAMTRRIPELSRAVQGAFVEVHPADASEYGLRNGDRAKLESRQVSPVLPVWMEGRERPPRGTVYDPFFNETVMVNDLTLDALDPFSKQSNNKNAAVRILAGRPR